MSAYPLTFYAVDWLVLAGKRQMRRPTAAIQIEDNQRTQNGTRPRRMKIRKGMLAEKWASDKRMVSRVYRGAFLPRAARARGRNLRSPRIT
jgi:hypothetical protein